MQIFLKYKCYNFVLQTFTAMTQLYHVSHVIPYGEMTASKFKVKDAGLILLGVVLVLVVSTILSYFSMSKAIVIQTFRFAVVWAPGAMPILIQMKTT